MAKRNKEFTTTQAKLTSHRMKSATLGTHVPRRILPGSKHMNADAVGFSNTRKKKRAARGVVDTLLPTTASGESHSQFSRRVSRREFSQEIQRKARVRRIIFFAVALLVVLGVAGGVGVAAFFGSLDSRMNLGNSDAKNALVAPKQDSAWYALAVADLGAASAAQDEAGPDALLLVRVDEAAQSATVLSLPANLQVVLSDGKVHKLREAAASGDAALISAVSTFSGVSISHFVKTDEWGLASLVDALGGVEVNVVQEVDDPKAGNAYLSTGVQTLDGALSLTYLRAQNFKNGIEDQAQNQRDFFAALAQKVLASGDSLSFVSLLDTMAGTFRTDLAPSDVIALAKTFSGIEASEVQSALVPGYETTRNEVKYYVPITNAWTTMMDLVKSGQPPVIESTSTGSVDRASFNIEVRNGAGITGGGAQVADILRADGFDVAAVGNADAAAFPETLVVYDGAERKALAEEVVSALGTGRTVVGAGYYAYETEVLVILGKDWKPLN